MLLEEIGKFFLDQLESFLLTGNSDTLAESRGLLRAVEQLVLLVCTVTLIALFIDELLVALAFVLALLFYFLLNLLAHFFVRSSLYKLLLNTLSELLLCLLGKA